MNAPSNVWGVRLLNEDVLSATCMVFESADSDPSRRPKIKRTMMELMNPASIQQRLNRKASPVGLAGLDHAQRWRQGAQDVDPILVVVAASEDEVSVAKAFCAEASKDVLLAVLLICRSPRKASDWIYEVAPWEYPLNDIGKSWCTLDIRSADPYVDAIRIADALTLRTPGLIGVDFQDVLNVMADGRAGVRVYDRRRGEKRAGRAALNVLQELTTQGARLRRARSVLVHMTSDRSLKHGEIKTIANLLRENVGDTTEMILSHAYRQPTGSGTAQYLELDVFVTFDDKASIPSRLEAASEFGHQIDNEDLTTFGIPSINADWMNIVEFALTFDGYQYWGSGEVLRRFLNTIKDRPIRELGLTELRTRLFFEQRAWRDNGHPDREAMGYIRSLVREIRSRVSARKFD